MMIKPVAVLACLASLLVAPPAPTLFRVTLLGTGTPTPSVQRLGPSTLVEAGQEKLIIDVGRDVYLRLAQLQIPFASITGVLFTHLHSDHVSGLPDLWLTGRFEGEGRHNQPLDLWGPVGTESMARHLTEAFEFDLRIRRARSALEAHDIAAEGVVMDRNGVRVSAFTVDHGPVKPAFGYRIEYGGHVVVLSGDTTFSEHLIEKAAGADLLVHEVAAAKDDTDPAFARLRVMHTSPEDAGRVFARVHPKLAVFSHVGQFGVDDDQIVQRTRKTYDGPLVVGSDLMAFDVGDKIHVIQNAAR